MAEYLEPGTLDKIRENIGPISDEEAKKLSEKLGGKILQERSSAPAAAPSHNSGKRSSSPVIRPTGKTSSSIPVSSSNNKSSTDSGAVTSVVKGNTDNDGLPIIEGKELKQMERLMSSGEYNIRPNYGVFNFILLIGNNKNKLNRTFGSFTIKKDMDHLQGFINAVKAIIQISPDIYKTKIHTEPELKFKLMRTVGSWNLRDLRVMAVDLENNYDLTIPMLVPFIKNVYKMLLVVHYIGQDKIPLIIKEVYADLLTFPDSNKKKLQILSKQAITEWLYVQKQIIKGLYPLLMRMCSKEFVEYPEFFTVKANDILSFIGLTKYDLLMPEKKKSKEELESQRKEMEVASETNEEKKRDTSADNNGMEAGTKDEYVRTGLKMLEQLFPDAGFSRLDAHPDMYPYFQPIYKFVDGFNMLAPENGLQVTIVLLKIIEELFQGCRNVRFNLIPTDQTGGTEEDISKVMLEWAVYSEDLFGKKLGDYIRTYVNSTYSQADFVNSQYAKETMTNILWLTKYYFLPYYEFTQLILKKPRNDNPYKSLSSRVFYLKKALIECVKDTNGDGSGLLMNRNDRYHFDLSNNISKRLDVLLGAKKLQNSAATNANLIKYTACIVAVLDWWINNKDSPAYSNTSIIYRISDEDGTPVFSVPERKDQNTLFIEAIKKAVAGSGQKK